MASIEQRIEQVKKELYMLTQAKEERDGILEMLKYIEKDCLVEVRVLKSKVPNCTAPHVDAVFVLDVEERKWIAKRMQKRLEG